MDGQSIHTQWDAWEAGRKGSPSPTNKQLCSAQLLCLDRVPRRAQRGLNQKTVSGQELSQHAHHRPRQCYRMIALLFYQWDVAVSFYLKSSLVQGDCTIRDDTFPHWNCSSPTPGSVLSSELDLRGNERATWFPPSKSSESKVKTGNRSPFIRVREGRLQRWSSLWWQVQEAQNPGEVGASFLKEVFILLYLFYLFYFILCFYSILFYSILFYSILF